MTDVVALTGDGTGMIHGGDGTAVLPAGQGFTCPATGCAVLPCCAPTAPTDGEAARPGNRMPARSGGVRPMCWTGNAHPRASEWHRQPHPRPIGIPAGAPGSRQPFTPLPALSPPRVALPNGAAAQPVDPPPRWQDPCRPRLQ